MEKLSAAAIAERLPRVPEWAEMNESLQRTFTFDTFVGAMAFLNHVADVAERVQHHPDMLVRYNKVTLTLSTHDANGLTDKDFDFASEIDSQYTAPAAK